MKIEDQLTVVIKTFMRESALFKLLKSIEKSNLRTCKIIISDDSKFNIEYKLKSKFNKLDINYLHLPFDSGLSYGRNRALFEVKTPYFLLCDDDFTLDKKIDFEYLINELDNKNLDILSGYLKNYSAINSSNFLTNLYTTVKLVLNKAFKKYYIYNYLGYIEENKDEWIVTYYSNNFQSQYSDVVLNFFIANTTKIKNIGGWNNKLKIGEHLEFFVRCKREGIKVGFSNNLFANHYPERSASYNDYRERGIKYFKILIEHHNIKRIVSYYPEINLKKEMFINNSGEYVLKEEKLND